MRKVLRYLLILIPCLVLAIWVWVQSHNSQLRGQRELPGLSKPVSVIFDDYGIPHIYGKNQADTYYAFGYIHAQDRLFQMELMRRVGKGRLAEIFGNELVEADVFFRTIGTHRKAAQDAAQFESQPESVKAPVLAYLAGVNQYIASGKLPIEFKLIGIDAEPYTVEDIYAISAYMAYSFAFAMRTDPLIQKMRSLLTAEYMTDFDLAWQNYVVDTLSIDSNQLSALQPDMSFILDRLPVPVFQGSNNWMLSSKKTLSGKVIFANDTHIKYSAPAVFYEAHLEYPGYSLYGHFLAGIPFALVGHTRNHAWGLTMFENDDTDFFVEQFISNDSKYTIFQDSLRKPVQHYTETILIKNGEDSVFDVLETVHGPIVNGILPVKFSKPVSMYWTYLQLENNLLEAFYITNTAANLKRFKESASLINAPGLNLGYADASGNICWWGSAKLPIRLAENSGKQFLDGSSGKDEYLGFYSFEQNPTMENPAAGYLVTANELRWADTLSIYPGYYAPQTRYDRIASALSEMRAATIDSMAQISIDVISITEAEVAHEIANAISLSNEVLNEQETQALELLRNWNGAHRLRDQEPTLYYLVLYHILERTYSDELDNELFELLLHTHMLDRSYPKLIKNAASPWWDDVTTPLFKESRRDLFAEALKESVFELNAKLGSDMNKWRWSEVHATTHPHPLGKVKLLEGLFNVGPFASPGGNETVNNAGFTFNPDLKNETVFGPAMRIIIDFADVENALTISPTGNSGNVLSKHYKDQAEMYLNGEFRPMLMNEEAIRAMKNHLLLVPEK